MASDDIANRRSHFQPIDRDVIWLDAGRRSARVARFRGDGTEGAQARPPGIGAFIR